MLGQRRSMSHQLSGIPFEERLGIRQASSRSSRYVSLSIDVISLRFNGTTANRLNRSTCQMSNVDHSNISKVKREMSGFECSMMSNKTEVDQDNGQGEFRGDFSELTAYTVRKQP